MYSAVPLLKNFTGLFPNLPQCFCHYKKNILLAHVLLRIFLNQTEILFVEKFHFLKNIFVQCGKRFANHYKIPLIGFGKCKKLHKGGYKYANMKHQKSWGKCILYPLSPIFMAFIFTYMLYATTF